MKRLPLKNALLKKVLVMCTSALWHGLYPGDAACLPAAVAVCSHSAIFRTPHPELPYVIFHAPLPPPCRLLLHFSSRFLLERSRKEALRRRGACVQGASRPRPSRSCDVCHALLQLLPKAVTKAVAVVWTILLLNYMTVGLLGCFFCTPLQLESTAIPCCWKN
jgi:hypothetical protein